MGDMQANMVSDVFGMEEFQGRARRFMTSEGNVSGRGSLPHRDIVGGIEEDVGDLAPLKAPPPTLANGDSYFDALFKGHPGMNRLLAHLGVESFETAIERQLPIPEHLWPQFPLTNEDVAHVDFERLMPEFPDEDTLEKMRSEHCPQTNVDLMDLLDKLSVEPPAADDIECELHRQQMQDEQMPHDSRTAGQDREREQVHQHPDKDQVVIVSSELKRIFNLNYTLTSLTQHCDSGDYLSGTVHCAHAQIVSSVVTSDVFKALQPNYGKYVQEGLPMKRVVGGPRDGKWENDFERADDPSHRGAGNATRLYGDWRASERWLIALGGGGVRLESLPANNLHFVLGIGVSDEAKRGRIVDYMTRSMGGVAALLSKAVPRSMEGLARLKVEGALPPLSEAQQEWMMRVAPFDCGDADQLRVLTSLFYPYIVERCVEEVELYRAGKCDLTDARKARLDGDHLHDEGDRDPCAANQGTEQGIGHWLLRLSRLSTTNSDALGARFELTVCWFGLPV